MSACKSTPETVAYKSLGSIAISVHAATQAYWDYRDANPGKISADLDNKLKSAYLQYQQAFAAAEAAEKIAKASGAPPDPSSISNVSNAASSFTALVSAANLNFKP